MPTDAVLMAKKCDVVDVVDGGAKVRWREASERKR